MTRREWKSPSGRQNPSMRGVSHVEGPVGPLSIIRPTNFKPQSGSLENRGRALRHPPWASAALPLTSAFPPFFPSRAIHALLPLPVPLSEAVTVVQIQILCTCLHARICLMTVTTNQTFHELK